MNTKEFTRNEFYDLVWATPVSKLILEYAISNDGFKKLCKQFEIPMPNSGYWGKLKFNKEVIKENLNANFSGEDKIVLTIREEGNPINVDQTPLTIRTKEIQNDIKAPLTVPDRLYKPDILIQNTKFVDEKRKTDHYYRPEKLDTVSIYVEEGNYSRALRIMDAFIKLLRYRGHSFRRDRNNYGPRIVVNDVEFHFSIREKTKRIPSTKLYESSTYVPTGILILKIGESYKAQEWSDGSIKLENQLAKIVAKIELEAQKELEWREECRLSRIKREEQEEIRRQFQKLRDSELQRTKELFSDAIYHNKARIIREYLNEIESSALQHDKLTAELQEWLKWAKAKADWFDPMIKKEDELLNEVDKEELITTKKTNNSIYRF
ncbi:hypothetical protein FEDK69T_31510 [Flavobacterium enshiense DK69]|uniref:Uncharacterized protein n=1 Tax=Flavobacterium enshiense DK69 TaxID=1107311 RepID=V6RZ86_9FLAO|nr:hypothetical protein [Flavobacterium enshiense]ESU19479.1 hypothetical protein FEDK69T_31510 [Flavobacterium enshiense DK69]KGO92816.1 hypothetical protein Q767_15345 [Flavobacterium enshiense DK69]